MEERHQIRGARTGGTTGGRADAMGGDESRLVTVSHGPYAERLPVGEMRVRDIRARYQDRLDIDPDSQAVVEGHEVGEDVVVRGGEMLMFVRKAGEKGATGCTSGEASWSG